MLFLGDAIICGGQFNSSNFITVILILILLIADFGSSTEKLAEFHKEL